MAGESSLSSVLIGAIIGGIATWYGSKKAMEYQLKDIQRVKRNMIVMYIDITTSKISACIEEPVAMEFMQIGNNIWEYLAEASFLRQEYDDIIQWVLVVDSLYNIYLDAIHMPEYENLENIIEKREFLKNALGIDEDDKAKMVKVRAIADKYREAKL